jgi:hypothetical protein
MMLTLQILSIKNLPIKLERTIVYNVLMKEQKSKNPINTFN